MGMMLQPKLITKFNKSDCHHTPWYPAGGEVTVVVNIGKVSPDLHRNKLLSCPGHLAPLLILSCCLLNSQLLPNEAGSE